MHIGHGIWVVVVVVVVVDVVITFFINTKKDHCKFDLKYSRKPLQKVNLLKVGPQVNYLKKNYVSRIKDICVSDNLQNTAIYKMPRQTKE